MSHPMSPDSSNIMSHPMSPDSERNYKVPEPTPVQSIYVQRHANGWRLQFNRANQCGLLFSYHEGAVSTGNDYVFNSVLELALGVKDLCETGEIKLAVPNLVGTVKGGNNESEIVRLREEVQRLRDELSQSQITCGTLQDENLKLTACNETQSGLIQDGWNRARFAEEERNQLQGQNGDLKQAIKNLSSTVNHQEEVIIFLKAKNQNLKSKLLWEGGRKFESNAPRTATETPRHTFGVAGFGWPVGYLPCIGDRWETEEAIREILEVGRRGLVTYRRTEKSGGESQIIKGLRNISCAKIRWGTLTRTDKSCEPINQEEVQYPDDPERGFHVGDVWTSGNGETRTIRKVGPGNKVGYDITYPSCPTVYDGLYFRGSDWTKWSDLVGAEAIVQNSAGVIQNSAGVIHPALHKDEPSVGFKVGDVWTSHGKAWNVVRTITEVGPAHVKFVLDSNNDGMVKGPRVHKRGRHDWAFRVGITRRGMVNFVTLKRGRHTTVFGAA